MAIFSFIASLFGGGIKKPVYENLSNVAYGTHQRQVVDIGFPGDVTGDVSLVLFIHGGGWVEGSKDMYRDNVFNGCPSAGIVGAALNYRYISQTVHMNDLLDDITSCLATVKAEAAKRNMNVNKVLFTGSSAGAHLSLLYAYSRKAESPVEPVAVVSYCGPTNLASEDFITGIGPQYLDYMCTLFSYVTGMTVTPDLIRSPELIAKLKEFSPLTYVDENTVPTVICHGMKDDVVPYSNAVELDAALTQAGVTHRFISYPNSGHGLDKDPTEQKIGVDLLYEYALTYLR